MLPGRATMHTDEGAAWRQCELVSFDRQSRLRARVQAPSRHRDLEALPADCPRIARGAGVSYVAASFDREAVSQSLAAFDRLLAFDAKDGRLRVEAGASIADVQRFALARGWYLKVAPGHARATIGGCIAANAHGKNPARDGCFAAQLGALRLFHPRHGWIDAAAGSEAWHAAIGGFGLTGVIVEAELVLARAPASLDVQTVELPELAATGEILRRHHDARVLQGWHDARLAPFGRGVMRVVSATEDVGAPSVLPASRLPAQVHPWPWRLWNDATLSLANQMMARRWRAARSLTLAEALLPLDGAGPYFAAFGPRGLVESQWLLPHARFESFAEALTTLVRRMRPLVPLMSSKLFDGHADGVAFDGEGVALALHVAMDERGPRFVRELDDLALEHGGRPNPIKQSHLDAATLRAALPGLDAWRACIAAHNPEGLFRSELSRRLAW
jgi:decaprenylphospho-beta-D-ribofuranose 2-oxidase